MHIKVHETNYLVQNNNGGNKKKATYNYKW